MLQLDFKKRLIESQVLNYFWVKGVVVKSEYMLEIYNKIKEFNVIRKMKVILYLVYIFFYSKYI